MVRIRLFSLALGVLALGALGAGCSDPSPDDGGVDADVQPDADTEGDADGDVLDGRCDEPGLTRVVDCERCGMASQRCGDDGLWEPPGECLYQGECEVGDVETGPTPTCGEQQRLCDMECRWLGWEETLPGGECEAGQTLEVPEGCGTGWPRVDTCAADCIWVEGSCEGDTPCGGIKRTEPPLAEEICIPEGSFIRGDDYYEDTQPIEEVYLSAYFIDRYPVTNGRYIECVDAGACEELRSAFFDYRREDFARRPVQGVDYEAAFAFCEWDGGRRLLTEAEWEKAARGPAPRQNDFVWGDEEQRCDLVLTFDCPDFDLSHFSCIRNSDAEPKPIYILPDDVDIQPNTQSYYGVEMLVGGGFEIVSDFYSATYYSSPSSTHDPTGPETGDYDRRYMRTLRGTPRCSNNLRLTNRNAQCHDLEYDLTCSKFRAFRCGRDAELGE